MKKDDVMCPECGAGFCRLELTSQSGSTGEYRCPTCDAVLEKFDGGVLVAYRLTIQPQTSDIREADRLSGRP